jgi:uncharacterized damage-inducible protein DinB
MRDLSDRFRRWYTYERDCNAKTLAMIRSVPEERRTEPGYQRSIDLLNHLAVWRHIWLHRMGKVATTQNHWFPEGVPIEGCEALLAFVEEAWTDYLQNLTDEELTSSYECTGSDGNRYRWTVEQTLTQLNGHAWYHRGQIAQLVDGLGGTTVDTDYFFWNPPEKVGP